MFKGVIPCQTLKWVKAINSWCLKFFLPVKENALITILIFVKIAAVGKW